MRAAGQSVGQVTPPPVTAELDMERVAELAAHLRSVLGEVDADRLDAGPALRDRIEAAAAALEALCAEPGPVDLDRSDGRVGGPGRVHTPLTTSPTTDRRDQARDR